MPVQNQTEEIIFALFARSEYRHLRKCQPSEAIPNLNNFEMAQWQSVTETLLAQPEGYERLKEIETEVEKFLKRLKKHYDYGPHYRPWPDNFSDAREQFFANPALFFDASDSAMPTKLEAIQMAGFVDAESMQVALRREAKEHEEYYKAFVAEPPKTALHASTATPESMASGIKTEGRLKVHGRLAEGGEIDIDAAEPTPPAEGVETSERFLKALHGNSHRSSPVEIMTRDGWRNALAVQAEERAKTADKGKV